MRYLLIILTLAFTNVDAQTGLNFDKRFVESEDKWVAFPMNKDSVYPFGFIYIDAKAGLTLHYEGNFAITAAGVYVPRRIDGAITKVRLQPNNVRVAFLPKNKLNELNLSATPDWLKIYKPDSTSIERLYRWGFLYNGWNECAKALTYLEKAEKINPAFKGLAVELAFSYNCLKEYDKAEAILAQEIKTNPADAYVNKEYIYTLVNHKKIDKAISQFESSVNSLQDNQHNAENCFNIMGYYYKQKDKTNFNKWYGKLQAIPTNNKMISESAEMLKAEMNK